jgi:hypothetical protein
VTPRCEQALFLHERFFDFMFPFGCDGWQIRATCLYQISREATATESLEILHEALENIL